VNYPISGKSQARDRNTLRNLGIPVLWKLLKQTWLGMVRNRSFSICFEDTKVSLFEDRTISLYVTLWDCFFKYAPKKKHTYFILLWIKNIEDYIHIPENCIHSRGLSECGIPWRTIDCNDSEWGFKVVFSFSDNSFLYKFSRYEIHCILLKNYNYIINMKTNT